MNSREQSALNIGDAGCAAREALGNWTAPSAELYSISAKIKCEPISNGVGMGVVQVIENMDALSEVDSGTVLVCPNASQKLMVVMPRLNALIAASGGLVAFGFRAAIAAGVPAVRGTREGLSLLKTGDIVRVDGTAGEIQVLKKTDA